MNKVFYITRGNRAKLWRNLMNRAIKVAQFNESRYIMDLIGGEWQQYLGMF